MLWCFEYFSYIVDAYLIDLTLYVWFYYQCYPLWLMSNNEKWCSRCLMKAYDIPNVTYTMYPVYVLVKLMVMVTQTNLITFNIILHIAQCLNHITYNSMIRHTAHNLVTNHTAHSSEMNPYCTKLSGTHTIHKLVVRFL